MRNTVSGSLSKPPVGIVIVVALLSVVPLAMLRGRTISKGAPEGATALN